MPLWKRLLLHLYYHGTYPVRVWNCWREETRDHMPVIVLCYHRIADDRANPWTISNAMFARQIHWLKERFHFVSLSEGQHRIARGHNSEPCISITFDDGYAENCQQAIPMLIRERIPCTYFITARNVLSEEPFLHDLMTGHCFATNTPEQLRAMAAAGIEIGVHSFTHADLGATTDARLMQYEVIAAKEALEEALGRQTRYFAFPYGQHANLSPAAFAMAKRAGYAGVCSAYGGMNFPGDDPFHLQRIAVDACMIRLKNWVTMDPRKRGVKRYVYEGVEERGQGSGVGGQGTGNKGTGIAVPGLGDSAQENAATHLGDPQEIDCQLPYQL
jgi:peptidoglycan/xylan/chitin deacetylase (PgdA/CDA1 family)